MVKNVNKTKKEYPVVYTPIGIISYPYLWTPDVGRKESSGKFSAEIYVPKAVFASEGKDMVALVTKVAREFHSDPKLKLADIQNPFKDMDTVKEALDWQKGTFRIRAKAGRKDMQEGEYAKYRPVVIAGKKGSNDKYPVFSEEAILKIKGGDHVRFICSVYGYTQQGGGVALGLNFVQFGKVGEAIGQGKMKAIENLSELEIAEDMPEDMVDVELPSSETDTDPEMDFG